MKLVVSDFYDVAINADQVTKFWIKCNEQEDYEEYYICADLEELMRFDNEVRAFNEFRKLLIALSTNDSEVLYYMGDKH